MAESYKFRISKPIRYLLIVSVLVFSGLYTYSYFLKRSAPIKVGILFSLSGTMAISEKSVYDAVILAIDEINKSGGINGRIVIPISEDTRSDWPHAAKMAEKLIAQNKVSAVFGCWTSACRKTVKPIFEKYNHLLFYPVQYEGLEASPNIVYTGAAPNQQIIPAVKWAFDHLGKRFFLVGSDYIFPRIANDLIKKQIQALGGETVGEEYILLGSKDIKPIIDKIKQAQPTVILNTINGDSNVSFFQELAANDIKSTKMPVISFSLAEDELRNIDIKDMIGHYAAWNYFQSIQGETNSQFVQAFKNKYGQNRTTDDPMEAAYISVYLWAQAVREAKSDSVSDVIKFIKRQSFHAPEGNVYIDPINQHTWKIVRIGKINENGQFDIVWSSKKLVQPAPYPLYQTKEEWEKHLKSYYTEWGNKWARTETKR